MKILLVEDERDFRNLLVTFLQIQEFEVITAEDGEEGLKLFEKDKFDVCVLDVMLPKMDGFSLGQKIKAKNMDMPIIFLTARNMKEDRLKGLSIADDYMTKPFEVEELIMRINNLLGRETTKESDKNKKLRIGTFIFDFDSLKLVSENESHSLTLKEGELLRYMINNKDKTLKRETVLNDLWGENDYFLGRSMDVFISRIRKYFANDKNIKLETIRGVGFILKD